MSFDIYGNRLRSGHCEVHPHVHEEYPCCMCLAEARKETQAISEYEHARRAEEDEYYARMFGDIELDSWLLSSSDKGANDNG